MRVNAKVSAVCSVLWSAVALKACSECELRVMNAQGESKSTHNDNWGGLKAFKIGT